MFLASILDLMKSLIKFLPRLRNENASLNVYTFLNGTIIVPKTDAEHVLTMNSL